jgi:ubiquinone/menaquinone biosynthesis C-methylase UbiE
MLIPLHDVLLSRVAERGLEGGPRTVLEVGIGPGHGVTQLGGAGRRVVGVDVSPRMLALARTQVAKAPAPVSLARATVLGLPFAAGRFDAVVATLVLDVLSDQELPIALGELARVLCPGGRLVLGVMEVPNRIAKEVWMAAYRAAPDLVGRLRLVDLDALLLSQALRVLRNENVRGLVGVRLVTLVKSVG